MLLRQPRPARLRRGQRGIGADLDADTAGRGSRRGFGLGRIARRRDDLRALIQLGRAGLAFGDGKGGIAGAGEGLAARILRRFLVGSLGRLDHAAVGLKLVALTPVGRPPDAADQRGEEDQTADQESDQPAVVGAAVVVLVIDGFQPGQALVLIEIEPRRLGFGRAILHERLLTLAFLVRHDHISSTASTPRSASPLRTSCPICAARKSLAPEICGSCATMKRFSGRSLPRFQ